VLRLVPSVAAAPRCQCTAPGPKWQGRPTEAGQGRVLHPTPPLLARPAVHDRRASGRTRGAVLKWVVLKNTDGGVAEVREERRRESGAGPVHAAPSALLPLLLPPLCHCSATNLGRALKSCVLHLIMPQDQRKCP